MNKISKLVAVALLLVCIVSCATVERVSSDDPFSNQLDRLDSNRQHAQDWLLASSITLVVGLITGTVATTLNSLGQIDPGLATGLIIASYSVSTLSAGWGTYQFFVFKNNFDEYLQTLRLQTQYYNTIQFDKAHP